MQDAASLPKILVVDDDTTNRLALTEALIQAGMTVKAVRNGEEGFQAFQEFQPDLVVSDIQMPEKDGYQLCEAIRSGPSGVVTPFLVMTGAEGLESVERSFEAGATDFISKPINYPLMVNRVRYILRAHQTFLDWKKSLNQLESLGRALDNSSNEIFFINPGNGRINSANKSALDNLGYSLREIGSFTLTELFVSSIREAEKLITDCRRLPAAGGSTLKQHFATRLRRRDGTNYPVEGDLYASYEHNSLSLVCICEDISERVLNERKMRQLAYYDSLTNLPNRELLFENFRHALLQAERADGMVGLLFVDLDNFKHVNDTLGHKAGDELLTRIAEVLRSCIRSSDYLGSRTEGMLARFGGDEFAVLLSRLKSREEAGLVASRMLEALSQPIVIKDREVITTPSIGIVIHPEHGVDPDVLLQRADVAMYEAKKQGKSSYQFYSEEMHSDGLYWMELERDLKLAIAKGEFRVKYQPKFSINGRQLIGFEALLRWNRNGHEISPDVFISLAEESTLIVSIGKWVVEEVCRQLRTWYDEGLSTDLSVAVNFSARQFGDPELLPFLVDCLDRYALSGTSLEVEITESVFMSQPAMVTDTLQALRELGCSIALDDFGTGYSSLSYLNRFPLDVLKIDRSFVSKINTESNNSIISAIVALSGQLGLRIVAEGVETEEQLAFLQKLQVDYLQGNLWGSVSLPEDLLFPAVSMRRQVAAGER